MNPSLQASWIEALNRGTAILDDAGHIEQLVVNGKPLGHCLGEPFRDVLIQLEPGWRDALPDWHDAAAFPAFLQFNDRIHGMHHGLLLDRNLAGDRLVITLTPHLGEAFNQLLEPITEYIHQPGFAATLYRDYRTVQSRLNHIVDHFPGVVFSQSPDFSFSFLSRNASGWLGLPCETLYKSSERFFDLVHPDDREDVLRELEDFEPADKPVSLNYRLGPLPDGRTIYIQDTRRKVVTRSGVLLGYEGVWLDITAQAMTEDRLVASSWKENVSLVTSGLAHDFRNIISGIFSLAELVRDSVDDDAPFRESLNHITEHSRKALKLVHRIVELNRSEPGTCDLHNLETLMSEQSDLLSAYLPRNIKLHFETTGDEIPVYLDKVEFERALLNLAINARDALSEKGGTISLRSRPVQAGETLFGGCCGGAVSAPEDGALIAFTDNGPGIPDAIIHRIFEPFFSTKESHQGNGLGLYGVRRFVENSRGLIDLKTGIGEGATFYLFLPQYDFPGDSALGDAPPGEAETPPEAGAGPRPRLSIVIFGRGELEDLDIVTLLRNEEIEVICLQSLEQVMCFVEDSVQPPKSIVHHCPFSVEEVRKCLGHIKEHFPDIVLMVNDPNSSQSQSYPSDILDYLIEPSLSPYQKAKRIIQFLQ